MTQNSIDKKSSIEDKLRIGIFSYPIRIFSCYFGAFIAYQFQLLQGSFTILGYTLIGLSLVIPHIGFLAYTFSTQKRRAIILFYFIDAALVGILLSIVQLSYIISVVYIITVLSSSLALNGPKFTIKSALVLSVSFLAGFLIGGAEINLNTTDQFSYLSAFYVVVHGAIFGISSFYFTNNISKVKNRISNQNSLILTQNKSLLIQNKEINERISYARDVQELMLPGTEMFRTYFKDFFIYYQPSEIVSGDFYYLRKHNGFVYLACVDCTGHGVPGAFMSMISYQLLDDILIDKEISDPKDILNELHSELNLRLRQEDSDSIDCLAISLIRREVDTNKLVIAGSYQPVIIFEGEKLTEIKTTRRQIGGSLINCKREFENFEVEVESGAQIYLFSDGIYHQLGGEEGGKFGYKPLIEKLKEFKGLTFMEQNVGVMNMIEDWRDENSQTDDITVIGIKI